MKLFIRIPHAVKLGVWAVLFVIFSLFVLWLGLRLWGLDGLMDRLPLFV